MALNHITIMGRLTRDVEVRTTTTGTKTAVFTVAVDRDFKSADGSRQTDFIQCMAWRQTAEFAAKYFKKGDPILVSGRLQISGWTDRDGNKRNTAEVVADNLYFCGGKRDSSTSGGGINVSGPTFTEFEDDGVLPWDDDNELPL